MILSKRDWDAFVKHLSEPPKVNAKLKALLKRVPIWRAPHGGASDD